MIDFSNYRKFLQFHTELNPKFWNGFELKKSIRKKFLRISDYFIDYCKISLSAIKDVYFVGGNANYNYTRYSDIDIHIIIDYNKIPHGVLDIDEFFRLKRDTWRTNHDVEISGYPVEFYVQDVNSKFPKFQGIFSLRKNEWVQTPEMVSVDYSDPYIIIKVNKYINMIESMFNNPNITTDAVKSLKEKLRNYRGAGLERGGEFSLENLVFKVLRSMKYIDKLDQFYKRLIDKNISKIVS